MTDKSLQKKRLEKFIHERHLFHAVAKTFTQSPTAEAKLYGIPTEAQVDYYNRIIRCVEEGKPFIASWYACAPEIYTAMNLPWYTFLSPAFTGALFPTTLESEIDGSERLFGNDMCTILRVAAYYIEENLVPIPTAMIGMIHPCDGMTVLHQIIAANENWHHVPVFAADPPYWEDERSIDYYVGELKRRVSFLQGSAG